MTAWPVRRPCKERGDRVMLRVSKGEKVMEKVEALGLAPLTFSDSLH